MATIHSAERREYLFACGILAAQVAVFLVFAFGGVAYPQVGALLLPTLIINALVVWGMHEGAGQRAS